MASSEHSPSHHNCPQSDQPPSYSTVGLQDIPLERYPTLPAYMNPNIPVYPGSPEDRAHRNDRIVERYHRWWRLRDSILTGFLCLGIVAAYGGVWTWRKRREHCLTEEQLAATCRLLRALLPAVLITIPTTLSLPYHYIHLAHPQKASPSANKTVPIEGVRLLVWGILTGWIWVKTPNDILQDAELVFYWGACVGLSVALGLLSILKLAMRIPWVMERKWGGEVDGDMKHQQDLDRNAVV